MNMTTCWNSSASFSCAINESKLISWLINGQDVVAHRITSPLTIFAGPRAQSTLIIPGLYEFDGAYVTC